LAPPRPPNLGGEAVRLALEAENIESRPLWKPMHLQPVFAPLTPQPWGELTLLPQNWGLGGEVVGGAVAEELFKHGFCLPSGTAMSEADQMRVVEVIRSQIK